MESIDITTLVNSLMDWHTWVIIMVVVISGVVGGLAHKLTTPPDDTTSYGRYIVVGAVASLAVLFVFVPKDPVRLIALALAAGYGGKTVLDALEARVKTAIAQAETAKAKDDGQKAVEAGRAAINYAQRLSLISGALTKGQPRGSVLEMIKSSLPPEAHSLVTNPPEDELKALAIKLDILEKSFQK